MQDKEKVNKICGSRLREARRSKNLTQEQLSDILQVDPKYISAIENGRRRMSSDLALAASNALGVRREYLLGFDDHPTSSDKIFAQQYTQNEMFDYLELLERNDYVLSTPFGDGGDTASLTFLSQLTDVHVISHENEHYRCSNAQLHTFFQNTHQIIETMKLMLVRQFLQTACQPLTDAEFNSEMQRMEFLFKEKYGDMGQIWLREQQKVDACKFDEVDKDAWGQAASNIGASCLSGLSETELLHLKSLLEK